MYEVQRIHDKRIKNGNIEYKVSWKGWNKNNKTWEPKENLLEFGAAETVLEYELYKVEQKHKVKYVNMNKMERAGTAQVEFLPLLSLVDWACCRSIHSN